MWFCSKILYKRILQEWRRLRKRTLAMDYDTKQKPIIPKYTKLKPHSEKKIKKGYSPILARHPISEVSPEAGVP